MQIFRKTIAHQGFAVTRQKDKPPLNLYSYCIRTCYEVKHAEHGLNKDEKQLASRLFSHPNRPDPSDNA